MLTSIAGALSCQLQSSPNAFDSRSLSNVLWAFATIASQHGQVVQTVASMLSRLKSKDLENLSWSLAKLELRYPSLNAASDAEKEHSMSLLAWACAKLSSDSLPLLDAMAVAAQQRIPSNPSQHLADLVWALATCSVRHSSLLEAVAADVNTIFVPQFAARDLANTAWAFAILSLKQAANVLTEAMQQQQSQQSQQSQHVALQAPAAPSSSSGVQSLTSNIKTRKRWADMEDEDGLASTTLGPSFTKPFPIHDTGEEPSDGSDWDAPQAQGSILEIQADGPDSDPNEPGESSSVAHSESSEGQPQQTRVWSSRAEVAATPKQSPPDRKSVV